MTVSKNKNAINVSKEPATSFFKVDPVADVYTKKITK
jgi:hypothetical protein